MNHCVSETNLTYLLTYFRLFDYVNQFVEDFNNMDHSEKFSILIVRYPRQTAKFIKNAMNVRHSANYI